LHYLFENCAFIYRFSFQKKGKDVSHQRRQNRLTGASERRYGSVTGTAAYIF